MAGIRPLDIKFNIDAYIENGGQILDLVLSGPIDRLRVMEWAKVASVEELARVARFAEFLKSLSELGGVDERVGDRLTEEQLRRLWAQTRA